MLSELLERPQSEQTVAVRLPVFVIGPFPPPVHGASLVTNLIAKQLAAVAEITVSDISADDVNRGVRYHITRINRVAVSAWRLFWKSRSRGRSIYMSLAGGSGILYNILLLLVARSLSYRIYLHHHSFAYIDQRSQLMAVLVNLGGRETRHICLCPEMENKFRNVYRVVGEVTVLSNAALMPPVNHSERQTEAVIRLGHLGNLFLEKGMDLVISLFRALCNEGIESRLVIAGPVPTQESARLIDAAKVEFGERFEYRGPVYGEDKPSFFRDVDVFVFPSRYLHESQPLVLFEAMSFGVPVISYARGCIGNDISDGGGLVIPPGSDFVAEAMPIIREWARDRSKLERSSREALEKAVRLREGAQAELHKLVSLVAGQGG